MDQSITKSTGWTIGLDLGDRFTEGCVLDEQGEVLERFRVRTRTRDLARELGAYGPSRVVLEVGINSPWISRLSTACGHETIVANPRRVRLIAENDSKSDTVDAELLARLARIMPLAFGVACIPGPPPRNTMGSGNGASPVAPARTKWIGILRPSGVARFSGTSTKPHVRTMPGILKPQSIVS